MTEAVVAVRAASPSDRALLASTLAAAFADDPVFSWLIPPGAAARSERYLALFGGLVESYLGKGHSYIAAGGGGAALWAPPGHWQTPMGDLLRGWRPMLGALRWRTIHSLVTLSAVERKHPKAPAHWYLGFLGTLPSRQGQGLGSALLRDRLEQAAGMPAYLESSNPRNLTLYRRHGFEVVEELKMPWGCPPIWRMWRPAAG